MSISSVSSITAAYEKQQSAQLQPNAPAPKPASPPQDSVHLSAAAKAASGDVDHDGDSH